MYIYIYAYIYIVYICICLLLPPLLLYMKAMNGTRPQGESFKMIASRREFQCESSKVKVSRSSQMRLHGASFKMRVSL